MNEREAEKLLFYSAQLYCAMLSNSQLTAMYSTEWMREEALDQTKKLFQDVVKQQQEKD